MNLGRSDLAVLALVSSVVSSSVFAAVDYTPLSAAVDVAGVTTAILAVGALMMAVVVVRWGTRKILGFFR
jgi:hypothetical protein